MNKQSFRLAFEDVDFLNNEKNRGVRLLLEYNKAEEILLKNNIKSTIVGFGSSRIISPEEFRKFESKIGDSEEEKFLLNHKRKQLQWYNLAYDFAKIAANEGGSKKLFKGFRHNVLTSGGGPGLMQAINHGAFDASAPSIGFNIYLPWEDEPNQYSSPDMTFRFHYFGIRKMHLIMKAKALAVFPGGFGTLDELMEVLNLISTSRISPIPVVLFDSTFWKKTINFQYLLEERLISENSFNMIQFADNHIEGWQKIKNSGLFIPD